MLYKITPVFLGSAIVDKGDNLANTPRGIKMQTVYSCFVLRNDDGEVTLVDTGLMSQTAIQEQDLPFRKMEDAPDLIDALKGVGVDPAQIRRCILTHLHYDHCCNLRLLPALEAIYVQQKEILYALSPQESDYYLYMLRSDCGRCEWLDGIGKFVIVDGDRQIDSGLSVILTSGHSRGGQCVVVETKEGKYILTGDTIALYESYEKAIPNSICFDETIWYASLNKIKALNAKILPSHDVAIFQRKVYG